MTETPRQAKRRKLDNGVHHDEVPAGFHEPRDGRDDTDELQNEDARFTPSQRLDELSNGHLAAPDVDEAVELLEDDLAVSTRKRASARAQKVDYAALNGTKSPTPHGRLTNGTTSKRKRRVEETGSPSVTPSKAVRFSSIAGSPGHGSREENGGADQMHNGISAGLATDLGEYREESPPPVFTPSRNRVWPKQYTNKWAREQAEREEAEQAERDKDPVVASPQSMLGRLVQAGKQVASGLRRVVMHGSELQMEDVQSTSKRGPARRPDDGARIAPRPTLPRPKPPRIEESEQDSLRRIVLEKLAGRRPTMLVGLDEEYDKIFHVAEQTVVSGEGNSLLVIGSRGSGKSAMMNRVVRELERAHMSDFHVIRLNGFIHTDDRVALREIWRQLGREMDVDDDGTGKSYADTLARLLALLSHPSEIMGAESEESIAKAVIFVMDEFDLFTSHPRQTLLYNLFDIAQSRKAPIAVFGLTTRIDVAEGLEKRVKSRFSHRYVHLPQAPNLHMFKDACRAGLSVHPEELSDEEKARLMPVAPAPGQPQSLSSAEVWNATVSAIFEEGKFLAKHITPHYHSTKSVPTALASLHLPVALASPATLPLNPTHFNLLEPVEPDGPCPPPPLDPPDSSLHLLSSLPSLSLALLVAAARCVIIHDTPLLNFRIAYAEYASLASKLRMASASSGALATGTKVWGREVARGCWEGLVKLGLLVPAQGAGGGLADGGRGEAREVGEKGMVKVDVALEEIAPSCPGMERAMEKWCRHI